MNNELKDRWKEDRLVWLELGYRKLRGGAEENRETAQDARFLLRCLNPGPTEFTFDRSKTCLIILFLAWV